MHVVDKLYFLFNSIRWRSKNRHYQKKNLGVDYPPEYMLYEAYKLNYQEYMEDGRQTAQWVVNQIKSYINLNDHKILEWGCGPARVVRHLPILLPASKVYGSDYNGDSISWCKKYIRGVTFEINQLQPPLSCNSDFFDVVYSLSVFTHLSEENHKSWIGELHRVLKKRGILLFTTQGNIFTEKLTAEEKTIFEQGKVVIRDKAKEGHRSYSAFHPEPFIKELVTNRFDILNFLPGKKQDWGLEQDTWILQKLS